LITLLDIFLIFGFLAIDISGKLKVKTNSIPLPQSQLVTTQAIAFGFFNKTK